MENRKELSRKMKAVILIVMAVASVIPSMMVPAGSLTPYTSGFVYYAVYAIALFTGCTLLSKRYENKSDRAIAQEMNTGMKAMVAQYNDQVRELEEQFEDEKSQLKLSLFEDASDLKPKYRKEYKKIAQDFKEQKQFFLSMKKLQLSQFNTLRSLWGWAFVIAVGAMMVTCVGTMPTEDPAVTATALSQQTEAVYWSAENIPIPYLQDATQYVSNPDHVLSEQAVAEINATMKRLEDSLNVQSVVIVVNRIQNDDPFRMAQDVGNRYGVGYGDRGLIIVVGYQDHSINMSPGRSLEADLTDAECRQLQQRYVIPAMKAEQPDSAMIYLADAIYATLQGKQLPTMNPFVSESDALGNDFDTSLGLYGSFLLALFVFFIYKNKKYQWLGGAAAMSIMANPFIDLGTGSGMFVGGGGGGGFSGGGGGFSGGGGGFSGGHFGGGSFGGGGATSRW